MDTAIALALTADNVGRVFDYCLFKTSEREIYSTGVHVKGPVISVSFHPERLGQKKSVIRDFLDQLPDAFHEQRGEGASFLGAIQRGDGMIWGKTRNAEQLMLLGLATKQVVSIIDQIAQKHMEEGNDEATAKAKADDFLKLLPGGVPYYTIFPA